MSSITVQTHVGSDGVLKLAVPVGLPNTDVEVTVIVQPVPLEGRTGLTEWPAQFFEQTYGVFADEPLVREDQGDYEVRDKLL